MISYRFFLSYRIMAEHGLPLIDHCLFEDHPMIRRAATECVANLAQSHGFVISSGGTIPLDDTDLAKKLSYLTCPTERVKLLVLYCGELDDLLLVRAASGALASMSYDPGIIRKITNVSLTKRKSFQFTKRNCELTMFYLWINF